MDTIIGVDIAKNELMIYVNGEHRIIGNDKKSIKDWLASYKGLDLSSCLFTYEPTGGYEKVLARYLDAHHLRGCPVHANHVRAYAKSMGRLAKTDKIDAQMIAEFAKVKGVTPKSLVFEHEELTALMQRREQIIALRKMEKSRLETLTVRSVIKYIHSHLRYLEKQLSSIEATIHAYLHADEALLQAVQLLVSIPGVGEITAVSILVYLPEIRELHKGALAALSGLAPMNMDSGNKSGKRKIIGGRPQIRRVLYMAALTATRFNPVIRDFYERLQLKGKHFKVALTACMRKLLTIIRSVLVRGTPWVKPLSAAAA